MSTVRHPGAANARQGMCGTRPGPMHLTTDTVLAFTLASRRKQRRGWVPAWSRLLASLASGAGMTDVMTL